MKNITQQDVMTLLPNVNQRFAKHIADSIGTDNHRVVRILRDFEYHIEALIWDYFVASGSIMGTAFDITFEECINAAKYCRLPEHKYKSITKFSKEVIEADRKFNLEIF